MDGYSLRASDTFGASEGTPAYFAVVGEVAMGQAAAHRRYVADANRRHPTVDFSDQGRNLLYQGGGLHFSVPGHGTDAELAVILDDMVESPDAIQSHQVLCLYQGLLHENHQRRPARYDPRILTVLVEQRQGLLQTPRAMK